jgi:peptide/nickel transport system substrate-binding protein
MDKLIQTLSAETDIAKRNATIATIWAKLKADVVYIPVHHQALSYGMKSDLDIPVDVSNQPKLKFVTFKRS